MSEQQPRIYVGNARQIGATNGMKISVNLSKIAREAADYVNESKSKDKYVTLNLWPNQAGEDRYGNTHYLQVDTWKPEKAAEADFPKVSPKPEPKKKATENKDDLPF